MTKAPCGQYRSCLIREPPQREAGPSRASCGERRHPSRATDPTLTGSYGPALTAGAHCLVVMAALRAFGIKRTFMCSPLRSCADREDFVNVRKPKWTKGS